jgi:hypothetical protein
MTGSSSSAARKKFIEKPKVTEEMAQQSPIAEGVGLGVWGAFGF